MNNEIKDIVLMEMEKKKLIILKNLLVFSYDYSGKLMHRVYKTSSSSVIKFELVIT